jgi:hypothetical protein
MVMGGMGVGVEVGVVENGGANFALNSALVEKEGSGSNKRYSSNCRTGFYSGANSEGG